MLMNIVKYLKMSLVCFHQRMDYTRLIERMPKHQQTIYPFAMTMAHNSKLLVLHSLGYLIFHTLYHHPRQHVKYQNHIISNHLWVEGKQKQFIKISQQIRYCSRQHYSPSTFSPLNRIFWGFKSR